MEGMAKQGKPLIWAHRGASGYAPENTLEAFDLAAKLKADGVELDVQLTKDGELVVIHDETIDRTSNGKGEVVDYTLEELRKFNYNKTHPEFVHADIPTLREVIDLLKPTGLLINIELKTGINFYPGIEKKTIELVKETGMEDRVIYSSFNHYSVKKVREIDPKAKVGFLYSDGPMDIAEYAAKHGVDALHPAVYNVKFDGFMDACRKHGLEVNVWTANTKEDIDFLVETGVHAVIGNYPDKAREWVTGEKVEMPELPKMPAQSAEKSLDVLNFQKREVNREERTEAPDREPVTYKSVTKKKTSSDAFEDAVFAGLKTGGKMAAGGAAILYEGLRKAFITIDKKIQKKRKR